jgi:hypothetical protein
MSSTGSVIDYRTAPVAVVELSQPPIVGEATQLSLVSGSLDPYDFKVSKDLSIVTGMVT